MDTIDMKEEKMRKLLLSILFMIISSIVWSQTSNSDFQRIKLFGSEIEYSGIAISPDQNTIAISAKKSEPVSIVDWKSQKVIQEFNSGNWIYGSRVNYSESGKYLILQELNYMDFSQNKDRKIDFEVVDAQTGKSIRQFKKVQDLAISSNEKYAVSLDNDEVTFWNLTEGTKERSINIPGAANALALSADGKTLAIASMINPENLKASFKKDKKGLKNTVKYKQIVSLYNVESGSKIVTIGEFYDLIYKLRFLPDTEILSVFQTPEISIQTANNKQSTISLIDAEKREPLRQGFTSMSVAMPEMRFSNDKKLFAINSKGNKFQEIHLYDTETGTLQKRFELANRLFEKSDGAKLQSDSRPSFTFLAGDQSILIAMGNQLVVWNFEFNE
jgi:DNA-binding beta-propeller fold protein YncE